MLRISKKNISSSIGLMLIIVNPKIVLKQLLSLVDLSKTQAFYIQKVTQFVIVHKNKDFMLIIF